MSKNSIKPNIIIVEDSKAELYLFETALKESKLNAFINLMVVRDGEETLNLIERLDTDIHLILLDLNLPRIPGKEVLKEIRKQPKMRNTPIIVLSNSDDPKDVSECFEYGADRYIQKPGEFNELSKFCSAIRRCIEQGNAIDLDCIEKEFPELIRLKEDRRRSV